MQSAVWTGPLAEDHHRLHARAAEAYEELYRLYLKGQLDEAAFKRHRAFYGLHSRPSDGRVMARIKVMLGRLGAAQLRAAAELARRFTPTRSFHLTTRQNLQFYDVALEDSPTFLHAAADAGFGVAASGGFNPRNVTFPAGAGLGPGESFDATWAASLILLRLEADEALRGLPGKVKIGFWRTLHDEESEPGNDITIIPVRRLRGTRLRRGFRLLLGGGLGATPQVEALWKSFVLPEELYAYLRAALLHFKAAGAAERPYNRLRHLVRSEGWPVFQATVEKIYAQQPQDRAATFFHRLPVHAGPAEDRLPAWLHGFAVPQDRRGRFVVKAQLLAGNLSAEHAEDLADLAEGYGGGSLRLSTRQQVWIPGVPEDKLLEAYQRLEAMGMASPYMGLISACPGDRVCGKAQIDTEALCKQALNALDRALGPKETAATQGLKVGVSGCTGGCGHHRSADLGLEGLHRRLDGSLVPFVRVYLRPPGDPQGLAQSMGALPQALFPTLLQRLVQDFRRSQAGDLASFLRQEEGWKSMAVHLGALAPVGSRPGEDRGPDSDPDADER